MQLSSDLSALSQVRVQDHDSCQRQVVCFRLETRAIGAPVAGVRACVRTQLGEAIIVERVEWRGVGVGGRGRLGELLGVGRRADYSTVADWDSGTSPERRVGGP